MTKASRGKEARADYWRSRIAAQERGGMSVGQFYREQGLAEQSFYAWRKRLQPAAPGRFVLVETGASPQPAAAVVEPALELVLTTGERLRIGAGVNAAALRTVLAALRV